MGVRGLVKPLYAACLCDSFTHMLLLGDGLLAEFLIR
jgi:hypothetical protein